MAVQQPDKNYDCERNPNLQIYNAPAVAQYYATLEYLTSCEQLLFGAHLHSGMNILDIGVGGGRTTRYLASIAGRYVGADYAPEMIAACRKKYPQLEFVTADAADLSPFSSSSFHAVVMTFNTIDYLFPDESRFQALREVHRVLAPEGIFIFSTHNPRSIWIRPSWNRHRLRNLAETIAGRSSILAALSFSFLAAMRVSLAVLQSLLRSLARAANRLSTRTFWRGDGYWMDPAHGGLKTHFAVPSKVAHELDEFGFRLLQELGDDYPRRNHLSTTDWYYYVFSKKKAEPPTGEA